MDGMELDEALTIGRDAMDHEDVPGWVASTLAVEVERLRALVDPDLLALHRVALQAREAVAIAAVAGIHLGPLRAALDETAYRVSG